MTKDLMPVRVTPTSHDYLIPHVPLRGYVRVDEEASLGSTHSIAIMEGAAFVTYHAALVIELVGVRCLDLGLPVVATWIAGDGTFDRDGLSHALPVPDPGPAPTSGLLEHADVD